jgi:acyl-CoA thioesterase-2
MPIITLADTLASLAIEEIREGHFTAPNIRMPYRRIFGGQLLAQALLVAEASAPGKQIKSLHAAFPSEGDLAEGIEYRVTRHQTGRTFATLSIDALQGERTIMTATASLHQPEAGARHQSVDHHAAEPETATPVDLSMIPWETRVVGGVDLTDPAEGPSEYQLWMRSPGCSEPADIQRALIAHATDLTLIGTSLRGLPGLGEADAPERIQTAVTTHTLWFHDDLRLDEWILLDQRASIVTGHRGFATGRVYARDGSLRVSYAQESLLRPVV